MSQANVFVKVGTTMARVRPERAVLVKHQLEQASKIKSPKQARAARNAIKCGRNYPKFVEGMSTQQYATKYYDMNYTVGFARNSEERTFLAQAQGAVRDFFQPLSTAPQYSQSGEVIEEVLA